MKTRKLNIFIVCFLFFCIHLNVLNVFAGERFSVSQDMIEDQRPQKKSVYRIGPEDRIKVEVWGNPTLSGTLVVRPDGRISLPLLGEVYAAGLSPNELKSELTRKFSEFINNPEITITVLEVKSLKIHVFGNVTFAGTQKLKGPTTVLEFFAVHRIPRAIDLEKSFIVRNKRKLNVNLYNLILNGAIEEDIPLVPGDLVYFKDLKSKMSAKKSMREKIRVIGAVKRPTVISYRDGVTVLDALMSAGGCTDEADRTKIKIIRKRGGNKVDEVIVNIQQLVDPDEQTINNVTLRPGDILMVPKSWFSF